MTIDPVCKMEVDEENAAATYEYQGATYYFCSRGCKTAFEKDPEQYLEDEDGGGHQGHEHHHHH